MNLKKEVGLPIRVRSLPISKKWNYPLLQKKKNQLKYIY